MPELPEVETVRRGLEPVMAGGRIERVILGRPDLRFPLPERFADRLAGRRIEALGRRAKYLLADLEGGTVLAMHLGMSGSFRIESQRGTSLPGVFVRERSQERLHDHVCFDLKAASGVPVSVIFNDPRRFGYMSLIERVDLGAHPHFRSLGIEPTGNALSGPALAPHFAGRTAPLKAALLDQKIIAGLGNIYVCEALWRARLSPRRAAGTLVTAKGAASTRLNALAQHIRETIADAIAAGGSSLRDYRQADGSLGYFQHRFAVYDREDEPCQRKSCCGIVKRIVQSGRSTFYCPVCQR
ncbi:bifunctional DNA-formamidopyrimidine glycosylase/DNA-(apurinic or apyrimidinic site) lyase [Jiella sp. MQZ9-1]|uniref:Formamidopyrimidine-DNA glycosylase n=1 Tax=Jiella flava TaxID=2816857 RepID=A0A939JVR0_9HYPH|nr:bifunctional DNA-formamidopyrimidine glycosylase/DNA-(apurinic or apyrimidinic site) lyase [Jiella flava]MBO0661521.1 bifunctional DNA-formamidopyrimidine glycosylase/DNA-(apurinic or apyrimidinic site) lyase [Jiella flava]MCD2470163.1 bifunctional DNA-formamidopyrimidine glycosylase/DNA-(apurinic or apyrimidinic site) lyase [Jiella flava]